MILEDVGMEFDGQLYLFKDCLNVYDRNIVFPKIYSEIFNWMNYIGEPEID